MRFSQACMRRLNSLQGFRHPLAYAGAEGDLACEKFAAERFYGLLEVASSPSCFVAPNRRRGAASATRLFGRVHGDPSI